MSMTSDSSNELLDRIDRLQASVERLTAFVERGLVRRPKRRLLTIRNLLITCLVVAAICAWFLAVYRQALRQTKIVDQLVKHSIFLTYQPRESLLVSLLPGDQSEPTAYMRRFLPYDFFQEPYNISARGLSTNTDPKKLVDVLGRLPSLRRVSLGGAVLKTQDLRPLAGLSKLESLDLSRTILDGKDMPWIADLPLKYFDASYTRISDRAIASLVKCRELRELHLLRSSVTDEGLASLASCKNLRYLNLRRSPCSSRAVKKLAAALPECQIEWQPLILSRNSSPIPFSRYNLQFGPPKNLDPRQDKAPLAPFHVDRVIPVDRLIRASLRSSR